MSYQDKLNENKRLRNAIDALNEVSQEIDNEHVPDFHKVLSKRGFKPLANGTTWKHADKSKIHVKPNGRTHSVTSQDSSEPYEKPHQGDGASDHHMVSALRDYKFDDCSHCAGDGGIIPISKRTSKADNDVHCHHCSGIGQRLKPEFRKKR